MTRRKLNTIFLFVILGLLSFTCICYSVLSQELMISGDVSYSAMSFEKDSWETIINNVQNNTIPSYYMVGSTKEVDMGSLGTHTLRIANMSTPSECYTPGFSQTSCGFVLEFADVITRHEINSTNTNVGGWPVTSMRNYVGNDIFNALPASLKNAIIDTYAVSGHGSTAGETNFTSIDKIYLLSVKEVGFDRPISVPNYYDSASSNTRILDYYNENNNDESRKKMFNNSAGGWASRTPVYQGYYRFAGVSTAGTQYNGTSSNSEHGVSPAFRLSGPSFEDDSWQTIVSNVHNNTIPGYYMVGSTKTVDMGTFGTHTLRIANMSTPAECSTSGFSQTACGFVLEFSDVINNNKMNSTATNVGGWPASDMRTYVNSNVYNALPIELKNGIINTAVVSGHGSTSGETNFTSTDKLYLLSTHEVWEDVDGNPSIGIDYSDTGYSNTRQLDYYAGLNITTSSYSEAKKRINGVNNYWWLRTSRSDVTSSFSDVTAGGFYGNIYADDDTVGVSPAFRIG